MTPPLMGVLAFGALLFLIAVRIPIAIAMGVVGAIGGLVLNGPESISFILGSAPFETVFPYGLSVVPLFILMGVFAAHAGLSKDLYQAVHAFVGHFRGGLAMSTVGACAAFGAICGSSLATVATMARVAMPEMLKRKYDNSFAAASVAAGGTLGVLIPPSVIMVIYAILTEESVGKLFSAAILPGILATLLYMGAVWVKVRIDPTVGPAGEPMTSAEKLKSVMAIWPVALLFLTVIGGIYLGWFSPTEAAAVGVLGAFLLAAARKRMSMRVLRQCVEETAATSGMIFLILVGTSIFNYFIETTMLPHMLVEWIGGLGVGRYTVLILLMVFFVVLGCFMDSLSMILLTLPFVFPLVTSLGFDPIWFGIVMVSVVEVGLITPPVGMNLFVIIATSPGVDIKGVSRAVIPFIVADTLRIAFLILVPGLCLWLPSLIK
ncbi:MAG: TRAP transporter large permease [Sulfuritalea sp.]|nr:TRAP transporter large permease [Sulfuritalea sp.]